MNNYETLMRLIKLRNIAGDEETVDINKLESDFLRFSQYSPARKLVVRAPKLYALEEEEKVQVSEIVRSMGIANVPEKVDISGGFDYSKGMDTLIFLSLYNQINADHFSRTRSYLNPLIEKVYSEGSRVIRDFSIHEAIVGKVICKRDKLDLREVRIFPEKFKAGVYSLSVEIDTPRKTLTKFSELDKLIEEFEGTPELVLDAGKIRTVSDRAIELRKVLGSLSRYENPGTRTFEAKTNSCIEIGEDGTLFYLFNGERNIVVYFGENKFNEENTPRSLLVLPGEDNQHTLKKLVELDIFKPSSLVLSQRVKDLSALCESASRSSGEMCNREEFREVMEKLQKSETYFNQISDERARKDYALRQPAELLEFMVYPSSDDPIIHELLPRISWNSSMRFYHNTTKFIEDFQKAGDDEKKDMLGKISSSINFNNQQNNDVNVWLYSQYREFCEKCGIEFVADGKA